MSVALKLFNTWQDLGHCFYFVSVIIYQVSSKKFNRISISLALKIWKNRCFGFKLNTNNIEHFPSFYGSIVDG